MNTNTRCIRINLVTSTTGHAIPVSERAATLLDLAAITTQVGATLDTSDLFYPKVYVNDGLAEHRALRETLCTYGKQAELRVQA